MDRQFPVAKQMPGYNGSSGLVTRLCFEIVIPRAAAILLGSSKVSLAARGICFLPSSEKEDLPNRVPIHFPSQP